MTTQVTPDLTPGSLASAAGSAEADGLRKKLSSLTLQDLAGLSLEKLAILFNLGRTPRITDLHGPMNGLPLAGQEDPGKTAEVWKGKIFLALDEDQGVGINRITPQGGPQREEFEFRFTQGPPLEGEKKVVILDYDLDINPPTVRLIRDELRQLNEQLFLGTASKKTEDGYQFLLFFALQYRCPGSARLDPGATHEAWYRTMAPFEHHDSIRTQLFPHTCMVQTIAGSEEVEIETRTFPGPLGGIQGGRHSLSESTMPYPNPYNVVTRKRDELYVSGGRIGTPEGAFIARINPFTLAEKWRVTLRSSDPNHWNWVGLTAVHGNGYLYTVAGNLMAKINPDTGEHIVIELPQHEGQGGAVYNGFDVTPDGVIFAKCMESGHPLPADAGTDVTGQRLRAAGANEIPAFLVAVNPHNLEILASLEMPEASLGRVTVERRNGLDYVYVLGVRHVWRYIFRGHTFELDTSWGPVLYVTGDENPGTAVGLLGDWVIFQTNFTPSRRPLKVSAANVWNSERRFSIEPFPHSSVSQEFSKPAIDLENRRVYTADQLFGQVVALDFDPERGFSVAWQEEQRMSSFWALVAGKDDRQLIGDDLSPDKGDQVVWRDAQSGEEIVRTDFLDSTSNGSIVTPGFGGRFYYAALSSGTFIELTPVAKSSD